MSGYIDKRKSVTFQNTNNKHAKEEGRTVPITENWGWGNRGKGRNWRENPENPEASQVLGLAEIILWK